MTDDLTYEAARLELTEIVAKLESGGAPLAESMRLWERAEALAQHCQSLLETATEKLSSATTEE